MRTLCSALVLAAACSSSSPQTTPATPTAPTVVVAAAPPDAPVSDDEKLAAIQHAMNELDEAAQGCWAAAAVERFDIEGDVKVQIEIGTPTSAATIVDDTTRNTKLTSCLVKLLAAYRWAPPLNGQTIQLPFQFRAPDGQSVIDRGLVPWVGQGKVSVSVLLDENNTGNDAASMLEVAIAAGGTTGDRIPARTELWYFLGPATVSGTPVAAGDMVYVRPGTAREIAATTQDVHAMVVLVPGGREGTARAGALDAQPTPINRKARTAPIILPAAAAKTYGPVAIYAEEAGLHDKTLAASVLSLPAGAAVAEHVHANETELLYVLAGSGTLTVNGVALPVAPTSVIQVPRATKHAFTTTAALRAVQIYTPAGPEQRFKAKP